MAGSLVPSTRRLSLRAPAALARCSAAASSAEAAPKRRAAGEPEYPNDVRVLRERGGRPQHEVPDDLAVDLADQMTGWRVIRREERCSGPLEDRWESRFRRPRGGVQFGQPGRVVGT